MCLARKHWHFAWRDPKFRAADSARFVIADRHGSHNWLASWLLGQHIDLPQDFKTLVHFFPILTFQDLLDCRFPIKYRIALQGLAEPCALCAAANTTVHTNLRQDLGRLLWRVGAGFVSSGFRSIFPDLQAVLAKVAIG